MNPDANPRGDPALLRIEKNDQQNDADRFVIIAEAIRLTQASHLAGKSGTNHQTK